MAEGSKLTVYGASGIPYEFWVYPWGTELKPEGGDYLVLKDNGILYVGQTSNLSERFDNHHKRSCFDRNGKTHIGARLEPSEDKRRAIETDLINKYNPPCNG